METIKKENLCNVLYTELLKEMNKRGLDIKTLRAKGVDKTGFLVGYRTMKYLEKGTLPLRKKKIKELLTYFGFIVETEQKEIEYKIGLTKIK